MGIIPPERMTSRIIVNSKNPVVSVNQKATYAILSLKKNETRYPKIIIRVTRGICTKDN